MAIQKLAEQKKPTIEGFGHAHSHGRGSHSHAHGHSTIPGPPGVSMDSGHIPKQTVSIASYNVAV